MATAEAYESHPGVKLDLSDDESLGTAAADALFTLAEGSLKVVAATNRVLSIAGVAPSAAALAKTLEALNVDLPRLRNVDVSAVKIGRVASSPGAPHAAASASERVVRRAPRPQQPQPPQFPVCGILTTPYPCLVMQNGQRVLEGAKVEDSVVLKITADSVTITNASGRFTWKP